MNKKFLAMALALVLLIGGVVSGSLAWLTDKTDDVTNTFTQSNIDIKLEETETEFKMIPGHTIDKDPTVTVKANSEKCWLFIKVVEANNFSTYMDYEIATGWESLDDVAGVYYREVAASTVDQSFVILGKDTTDSKWNDNEVYVLPSVTSAQMTEMASNQPQLTFTAYAVQYYKTNGVAFTAAEAWTEVNK